MIAANRLKHDRRIALVIGVCLLVATYLVFSLRAALDPANPASLFSLQRLIATSTGAGFFILAVGRVARMPARRWSERLIALMWVTVAGVIALLAFRIGYDLLVDNRTEAVFSRNFRWVLTWLGYFAAAIGGYFAITFVRQAIEREHDAPAFTRAEVSAALMREAANWTAEERRVLAAKLSQIEAYEEADPLVGYLDQPRRG